MVVAARDVRGCNAAADG